MVWSLENGFPRARPQPSASWGVLGVKPKGLMKGEE
jgi:hypothetical protein